MATYVPGTQEKDLSKVIMSLQQVGPGLDTANSNISKLANNQFARVELITTNQTGLSDSVYTKINFNNVSFDPSGIWDATNKQFKPTVAGYYKCSWAASMVVASGNITGISSLHKSGTLHTTGIFPGTVPGVVLSGNSAIVHLDGNTDVIDVRAFISGTASRDIQARTDWTWFDICLVKAD